MIKITQETIIKTRQLFADIQDACIADVLDGTVKVNYRDSYIANCQQTKEDYLNGEYDDTFSFVQRARYIQTGESIPLFAF